MHRYSRYARRFTRLLRVLRSSVSCCQYLTHDDHLMRGTFVMQRSSDVWNIYIHFPFNLFLYSIISLPSISNSLVSTSALLLTIWGEHQRQTRSQLSAHILCLQSQLTRLLRQSVQCDLMRSLFKPKSPLAAIGYQYYCPLSFGSSGGQVRFIDTKGF